MNAYEKLRAVRDGRRPQGSDYVAALFETCVELHGDRRFGEDKAVCAGIGTLGGCPVTFFAIDRGKNIQARMERHFGCVSPEGYRKTLRLMRQAEKFHRPVVCFVDTLGALCGVDAEQRGEGQAIAENLLEMMGLGVPILSVIIGEGGSGGALALAAADRVYLLEHAVYSVISPEGCASILYKDASRVAEAAEHLHITADDMLACKVADGVIPENFENFPRMCEQLKQVLCADLTQLSQLSADELVRQRYERFRRFGVYKEINE